MKRVLTPFFALTVAASVLLPCVSFAQTASVPAPRGHRQPTAADVLNESIPVTSGDPLASGRSVSPSGRAAGTKTLRQTDVDTGPVERTQQICTNCDD